MKKNSWWIEIITTNPNYIYYFGSFNSYPCAEWSKKGYIQDLEQEGANLLQVRIQQFSPHELTIPFYNT